MTTNERFNTDSNGLAKSDYAIEMDRLPPAWFDVPGEVHALLAQAGELQRKLAKLYAKQLLPTFSSGNDGDNEIEHLTNEIMGLFVDLKTILSKFSRSLKVRSHSKTEYVIGQNILKGLAATVQARSGDFRRSQS